MKERNTTTLAGHVSPTAVWIVGQDAEGAQDYILHMGTPAFLAKLGHNPEDGALSALVYATTDERVFYDFIWFDDVPEESSLLALMAEAERALESYRNEL